MAALYQPNSQVFRRPTRPVPNDPPAPTAANDSDSASDPETEYDRERRRLAEAQPEGFSGWSAELRQWLAEKDKVVTKKTNLCDYWTVR